MDQHLQESISEPNRQQDTDAIKLLGELRGNVRIFPDNADERLRLAVALYQIGDLDAAIDEYQMALRLKPASPQSHLQLGVVLMAKQDWRAAQRELTEATHLDPTLVQAHYNLGTVLYTIGDLKAAVLSYQRALELQEYFPDARYRLALVLKLTHRDRESVQFMEEAAQGGISHAQYFLGNAYRTGQGVGKDMERAIYWWTRAVAFGHQQAGTALSQLRRQAMSGAQPERKRQETLDAFRSYREKLWEQYPDLTRNGNGDDETLGSLLLKQNSEGAVGILLQEGYALSGRAQHELAKLYETGWDSHLPPFDKTILSCFETTASEGFIPAKKILARIYGKGLGMQRDMQKAKSVLSGFPKQDAKALLEELRTP
jgi:TPR repeat protein